MASYKGEIPASHVQLLSGAHLYHILDNKVFVHGGFNPAMPISEQDEDVFLWDRELVYNALRNYFGSTDRT